MTKENMIKLIILLGTCVGLGIDLKFPTIPYSFFYLGWVIYYDYQSLKKINPKYTLYYILNYLIVPFAVKYIFMQIF